MHTLLEAVRELGDLERSRLSSISVERASGGYLARFDFAINLPHTTQPGLPEGVEFRGFQRWPQKEVLLEWRIRAFEQICELFDHGSGLGLGRIDFCECERDRWIAKTHAGSREERAKWALTK